MTIDRDRPDDPGRALRASGSRPRATRGAGGAGLEALLVGVGPDLRYLTGYRRCRSSG